MKNKEKYDLRLLNIREHKGTTRLDLFTTYVEIKYFGTIVGEYQYIDEEGVKKFFEWLEKDDGKECKPTILTEKEKAYLSAVIKPFREEVEYVYKICLKMGQREYLEISLKNGIISFPFFTKGTMYKGMGTDKAYTLKELGL